MTDDDKALNCEGFDPRVHRAGPQGDRHEGVLFGASAGAKGGGELSTWTSSQPS